MKRNIVIATLTAAALAGGTVVAFAANDGGPAARPGTDTTVRVATDRDDDADDRSDGAEDRTAVRGSGVSAAEAVAAALRHTPGTAVSAELEDDGADAGTWSVDVVRGDGAEYGVEVSGAGKVLGAHRDDDGGDDDSEDRAESAALKGAKFDAHEAALAAAAKGTVTEVDADDDSGAVAWNVETVKAGTTSEWTVALDTGKITRVQSDED
ncbi:PepSY domain-containing protein [Streptomyces sp. WI04-05B]|uniref:PepSY domain-containing protein n=1 Tax=Streptomyces TaxID=1883 RepID=UPI0029A944B0|nr:MULTISPECIES: PepSY domain-containing protein [unclassified Streptomyces]MDX2547052.1 PepSY domain-containing protein [Streptomyces sp. WI04-05B]MDX2589741.1 PepSY domain-containing protein [Streptomyces sp. WI04-05A]MDX3753190.1 PepSY domain-containing protein [Streptomyces sp. AK08-02]